VKPVHYFLECEFALPSDYDIYEVVLQCLVGLGGWVVPAPDDRQVRIMLPDGGAYIEAVPDLVTGHAAHSKAQGALAGFQYLPGIIWIGHGVDDADVEVVPDHTGECKEGEWDVDERDLEGCGLFVEYSHLVFYWHWVEQQNGGFVGKHWDHDFLRRVG